jgi:hypothetical protein
MIDIHKFSWVILILVKFGSLHGLSYVRVSEFFRMPVLLEPSDKNYDRPAWYLPSLNAIHFNLFKRHITWRLPSAFTYIFLESFHEFWWNSHTAVLFYSIKMCAFNPLQLGSSLPCLTILNTSSGICRHGFTWMKEVSDTHDRDS